MLLALIDHLATMMSHAFFLGSRRFEGNHARRVFGFKTSVEVTARLTVRKNSFEN
jgi:hypothetical protein